MSLWCSRFYGDRGHDPLTTYPRAWDTAWHTVHRQELPSKLTSICEFLLFSSVSYCYFETGSHCVAQAVGHPPVSAFQVLGLWAWLWIYLLSFALVNIFLDCLKFPVISDSLNIDIARSQDCLEILHMCLLWLYSIASLYWYQEGHLPWTYLYTALLFIVTVNTRNWVGLLGHRRLCAIKYIWPFCSLGSVPAWNRGYARALVPNLPNVATL